MPRIDQDYADDISGMFLAVESGDEATERMTHENIGPGDACALQQLMKFSCHALSRARQGAALAPSKAGTIIGADPRHPRNIRLHQTPIQ